MFPPKAAYAAALALAVAASLFLLFVASVLGLVGAEGDPFDRVYLAVVAVAVVTALVGRFRAEAMMHAAIAAALTLGMIAAAAFLECKHRDPATSVAELLGLHAMFAVLFLGSALLFRVAAGPSTSAPRRRRAPS